MNLKLMQTYGHRPIVLLGGCTTLIGDPSGKSETRKILNGFEIKKNIKSMMFFVSLFFFIKHVFLAIFRVENVLISKTYFIFRGDFF